MARPALSAERAIDILNFITNEPGHEFTLSELVQRLEVNIASCHSVLNALTKNGYLIRHPKHKTYTLGPALVAIGQASLERHPAIGMAREAAFELAQKTNLEVVLNARIGDEIVGLARYGKFHTSAASMRVGQHVPLIPPVGALWMAWSNEDDIQSWMQRLPHKITRAEKTSYNEVLRTIRSRGYAIYLENPATVQLGQTTEGISSSRESRDTKEQLTKLIDKLDVDVHNLTNPESGKTYNVNIISAPIFSPFGDTWYVMSMIGFNHALSTEKIQEYATMLVDHCHSITNQNNGRLPASR